MSARRTSRPDKFSYALGKRFLSLFPASFRREFGDPLLQAIQDELHTEANSRVQIITIWLRIIPDLLLAAFQEQYHQYGVKT